MVRASDARSLPSMVNRSSAPSGCVHSSGGHLRAAAAFLEVEGGDVAGALCVGRSDDGLTVDDAFAIRIDNLESFNPATEQVDGGFDEPF